MSLSETVSWIKPAFRQMAAVFSMVALIIVCFHKTDQAVEWDKLKIGLSNPFFFWYTVLVIIYSVCLGTLMGLPYTDHTVLFFTYPVIGMQAFFWTIFKFLYPAEKLNSWIVVAEADSLGLGDNDAYRKRHKVIENFQALGGNGLIQFTNTEGVVILLTVFFLSLYLYDKQDLLEPTTTPMPQTKKSKAVAKPTTLVWNNGDRIYHHGLGGASVQAVPLQRLQIERPERVDILLLDL
ncbi:hypothetical protein TYRP_015931, partial [Tyrophagus putrescentiae]